MTEPALKDLLDEIAQMRDKPVPAAELADSKRAIVASFALSLENPQSVLGYYMNSWLYGLPADYWDTYPARISAVTAAEAQAAAKKYWGDDRLQIVAVGDGTKIAPILGKYGTVEAVRHGGEEDRAVAPRSRESTKECVASPSVGRSCRNLLHRRREGVDLVDRRVDVRRDPRALVLGVDDRRGDDAPVAPTAARPAGASARR